MRSAGRGMAATGMAIRSGMAARGMAARGTAITASTDAGGGGDSAGHGDESARVVRGVLAVLRVSASGSDVQEAALRGDVDRDGLRRDLAVRAVGVARGAGRGVWPRVDRALRVREEQARVVGRREALRVVAPR